MATPKKFVPEAQDVTEPLPGMRDPISQAKEDAKADKKVPAKKAKMKPITETEKPEDMYFKAHDEATRFAMGGSVGSASKRADGCAQRGKTRGKMV